MKYFSLSLCCIFCQKHPFKGLLPNCIGQQKSEEISTMNTTERKLFPNYLVSAWTENCSRYFLTNYRKNFACFGRMQCLPELYVFARFNCCQFWRSFFAIMERLNTKHSTVNEEKMSLLQQLCLSWESKFHRIV